MSYLRYMCVFVHSGVKHILCCVCICLFSSCVPYAASFSGMSIFDCPFGILKHLFKTQYYTLQDKLL